MIDQTNILFQNVPAADNIPPHLQSVIQAYSCNGNSKACLELNLYGEPFYGIGIGLFI
jgi:hypothetical protein